MYTYMCVYIYIYKQIACTPYCICTRVKPDSGMTGQS